MSAVAAKSFVLWLLLLLAVNFAAAQKTLSAMSFYERGLAKIKLAEAAIDFETGNQKYREAVEEFGKAIESNAREAKFYLKRGECFDALFEPEKALKDFSRAVELKPDYAEAFVERAKVYATYFEEDGQYVKSAETALKDSAKAAKALADFNCAVETNQKNAAVYIARASFYFVPLEDYKAALADFNRAVEVEPRSAKAFLGRAGFYFAAMQNYAKALADCTAAIKLNQRNADGYELRADIYAETGAAQKAIADYTIVLKIEPNNPSILFRRAAAYRQIGKIRLAEADERKSEKLNKTAPLEARVFTVAVDERAVLPKTVLSDAELADSYVVLSKKDVELISEDAAVNQSEVERLTKVLQAEPEFADALFERGRAYARLKEYDRAIADFSKVIGLDPNDYHAFNNRGAACARSGNYERAIADFVRANAINPKDFSNIYNFGLVLFNKGSFGVSAKILTGYIAEVPNDAKSYQLRAKAFRQLGKISEADADEKRFEKLK